MANRAGSVVGAGENVAGERPGSEPDAVTDEITVHDEDARRLLDGIAERLVDLGMDRSSIDARVERDPRPVEAIADTGDEFDAVAMGEFDSSRITFAFGMRADQLSERFHGPAFVVQREPSNDD